MRTREGVGGSIFGLGSKNLGGRIVRGLAGVGVVSFEPDKSMYRGAMGDTLRGSG
jgi:hypothetical protein